jgi:hypothetical protein
MARGRWGEVELTGETKMRRGAMKVDGEVASVGCDGGEVADGEKRRSVNSKVWSALTVASCGDGERRPEAEVASGVVGVLDPLQL